MGSVAGSMFAAAARGLSVFAVEVYPLENAWQRTLGILKGSL
jgi:hypothetical protein